MPMSPREKAVAMASLSHASSSDNHASSHPDAPGHHKPEGNVAGHAEVIGQIEYLVFDLFAGNVNYYHLAELSSHGDESLMTYMNYGIVQAAEKSKDPFNDFVLPHQINLQLEVSFIFFLEATSPCLANTHLLGRLVPACS
jgi:hypothetical protein